jgi:hypothetical protein
MAAPTWRLGAERVFTSQYLTHPHRAGQSLQTLVPARRLAAWWATEAFFARADGNHRVTSAVLVAPDALC